MNSPADDIATLLQTLGLGTRGTNLFVNNEPAVEILTITLYDTPGASPNPKWLRDEPSIQIRVRGTRGSFQTAWSKAQAIKDALLGKDPTIVNGTNYVSLRLMGDLFLIGYQDERPVILSNWLLVREMEEETGDGSNRLAL